jgi:translocation and assembly module TamA
VRAFLAVALGVLALSPAAPAQTTEAPRFRVAIDVAEPALAKLLAANLDLVRWSTRPEVSTQQLRQLVSTAPDQARELLATEGYFSPQVEASLAGDESGLPLVRLRVTPGEPTRVASVELSVRGAVESDPAFAQRQQAAREAFTLKPGEIFRQADWAGAKVRAVQSLRAKHYAAAEVAISRADIDPNAHTARLLVALESGPPFRFGALKVEGLQRYPKSLVANASPIRPGAPYDEAELIKFQRRLLALGHFGSVVVRIDNDPAKAQAAPVLVTLGEAKARRVDAGVGYSTDRGARAQVEYTDRNFLDRAWRFNARAKVDGLSQEALANIGLPREASGWRNGLETQIRNQEIQGERRQEWAITGARSYTVEDHESQASLQMLNEYRELADSSEDERKALFLSQRWTRNALDDLLAPRAGWWARLQVGGAVEGLYTDRSFGRITGKAVWLLPVRSFGTLQLRAEAGVVLASSRDDIPSAYLFRTGGDNTIRGYAFESLGVAEGNSVVGGRYLGLASVEYVQWLRKDWGAAVFYDFGNAVDDLSAWRTVSGYGAGVRWSSPIGALSLDLAYGRATEEWRVHFNAGIAFR